ncbi:hypothetical protein IWQ55_001668 [Labrenzia sp. EL_208]|nr:hypothetical protein [Labrenzia sp. EL_132]MBG6228463.1 hypothetical protein [Labrenzia sp. EL_208]
MAAYFADGYWATRDRLIPAGLMAVTAYCAVLIYFFSPAGPAVTASGVPINDFLCFWLAGSEVVRGTPQVAYDNEAFLALQAPYLAPGAFYPFFYPPTFLLILAPLGTMAAIPAYVMSQVVSLAFAGAVCARILRNWTGVLMIAAMPATFNAVFHGQNALLCTAFLGAGLVALSERREVLAGLFIGLLTIKPQMGVLLPFAFLAAGYYRAFSSAAVTAITVAALSWIVLGSGTWQAFLEQAAFTGQATDQGMAGFYKMASVYASVRLIGLDALPAYAVQGAASLAALWVVWKVWGSDEAFGLKAAVLVSAGFFATPYVLPYDLAALAVAIAFLVQATNGKQAFPYMWTLVALAVLLSASSRYIGAVSGVPLGLVAPAIILFVSMRLVSFSGRIGKEVQS